MTKHKTDKHIEKLRKRLGQSKVGELEEMSRERLAARVVECAHAIMVLDTEARADGALALAKATYKEAASVYSEPKKDLRAESDYATFLMTPTE
jgi:hypothetical protein